MRGLGGFSLVLLLIMAGLIWAVVWGPWRNMSFGHPSVVNTVQPATTEPAGAAQTPAPPKARRAPIPAAESSPVGPAEAAAKTVEPVTPVPAVAPTPPAPAKFPTAVDVPIGTLGSAITDSFGPPVARTMAVDEGGRTEILIYRRSRPDTATVIHVRNGRVITAVTTAY